MSEQNWARTVTYGAGTVHRPASVEQLQELVSRLPRLRVLGSRHSFSSIADAPELVSLDALPPAIEVDHDAGTVSFAAGLRYGDLAEQLRPHGVALHNLASLPHISVAGAVATGTHGSGDRNGNLATAVAAVELVDASGELRRLQRGDPDFDGVVVGLGALGVVTRLTLAVEPAYDVRQRAFEELSWNALYDHFDEITSSGYSVSVFTLWGDDAGHVWIKTRADGAEEPRGDVFGARPATVERHPILGLDPVNCTPQLGVAGAWPDRLPHFRMGFTPSSGDEIQSEYLLPRRHARPAMDAVRQLRAVVAPLLQVSEIRTVAGDALWLSPQQGTDTVALHFTWVHDWDAVQNALAVLEAALEPFAARPHWGKVFLAGADRIATLYERLPDFLALRERLDARGAFVNPWLERHVVGRVP